MRVEDDHGPGARPPVEYATPAQDEGAWRETIDSVAPDLGYRTAVFLRVASVRPADDVSVPALEVPYRLLAERPYLVRVASHNPHLGADLLRASRLVPLYDELAAAVVVGDEDGLPADGMVELLIEPIVPGPGWLELNASLGVDLVPAASLGWVAAAPPGAREGAAEDELPSARPTPPAAALALVPVDPIAEAAVRAYAVVREDGRMETGVRLRLLGHLRAIAPDEPRLAEHEGIALYELGRDEEAGRVLASIPLDTLGAEGRATSVAAILRQGRLPDPLERVRIADLSRPDTFRLVLDASAALPAADQVRLAEFVVGRLLSDDRAADWLGKLVERPLPAEALGRLKALWADLDPGREDER